MPHSLKISHNYAYLTVNEAAALLRVSKYTIKRYLKLGKLVGIKTPGNHWRVSRTSCQEYISTPGEEA